MEIRIGNENDLPACLEIARALPDFFCERGISAMENNIIIPEWSPENICAIYVKAL
jgi:hypothetical protein